MQIQTKEKYNARLSIFNSITKQNEHASAGIDEKTRQYHSERHFLPFVAYDMIVFIDMFNAIAMRLKFGPSSSFMNHNRLHVARDYWNC